MEALPKPYYQDAQSTIYHGDCREILPLLPKVDLVLTDPPYGMEYLSGLRKKPHSQIAGDDALPVEIINICIEKAEYASYFFCRWDNLVEVKKPDSFLVWEKNNWTAGDLEHTHGRMWEGILFYAGQKHAFKKRIPDIIKSKKTLNNLHPTQKPVTLFRQILEANQGDLILDPFMGSGTTLIAAKNLGRKAIGIELEEKYCKIAVERLRQEVLPLC